MWRACGLLLQKLELYSFASTIEMATFVGQFLTLKLYSAECVQNQSSSGNQARYLTSLDELTP